MSLRLQIGKAEQVVKSWGWDVDRRRLKHWLDHRWVGYRSRGTGRGSLRFLTDESLMDVYLASNLCHDLTSFLVRSCIREARKHYAIMLHHDWASGRPIEMIFKIDHRPKHFTEVRVPAGDAVALIAAARKLGEEALAVERGRPARDWRLAFEEDLAEIGQALRAHGRLDQESIREDIRAYRRRQETAPHEIHVAVPASTS